MGTSSDETQTGTSSDSADSIEGTIEFIEDVVEDEEKTETEEEQG